MLYAVHNSLWLSQLSHPQKSFEVTKMAEYETILRQVEEDKENAAREAIKQKEKYVMTYESGDAEQMRDDEDSADEIELDDAELQAYMLLKEANKRIEKLDKQEADPNQVGNILLRSTERVFKPKLILNKLKEIELSTTSPWTEHLAMISPQPVKLSDHDDQVERELKFYESALTSAIGALHKLNQHNIKTERPDDYFAEMVKSDKHMLKVRASLLENQKVIEKREENRRRRELQKVGKQVRAQKLREKIEEKKANMKLVEYWKKKHGGKGTEFDLQQFEESVKKMQAERMQKYQEETSRSTMDKKARMEKNKKKSRGVVKGNADRKKQRPGKKARGKQQSRK